MGGSDFVRHPEYIVQNQIDAEELRKARKQLGLTQAEFAELIGCSRPTMERWERSKEKISGPIAVLVSLMLEHPEYMEALRLPEKHYPLRLLYMYRQKLCTLIDVDESRKLVAIRNYTDHMMFRAFGAEEKPDYEMYKAFLESRCFPAGRDKMKLILKDLGLPFYDPLMIIEKTEGRMAEDDFWIRIVR